MRDKNQFKGCPACGLMSFPPIFKPADKPLKPDAQKSTSNSNNEPVEKNQECPDNVQMPSSSFSPTNK